MPDVVSWTTQKRGGGMEPTWQPISALPMIASVLDSQIEDVEAQTKNLEEARAKPHVLDNAILDRVIRLYAATQEDAEIYEEEPSQ